MAKKFKHLTNERYARKISTTSNIILAKNCTAVFVKIRKNERN